MIFAAFAARYPSQPAGKIVSVIDEQKVRGISTMHQVFRKAKKAVVLHMITP